MLRRRSRLAIESRGAPGTPAAHSPDYAAPYVLLTLSLERARAAVNATTEPFATAADHQWLTALLATCISQAVAADAAGAPMPEHVTTWMGEALARSTERELALIAASDSGAVLSPSWVRDSPRPGPSPTIVVAARSRSAEGSDS